MHNTRIALRFFIRFVVFTALLASFPAGKVYACAAANDATAAMIKGDWPGALKISEQCVVSEAAGAPPPPADQTNWNVLNVHYWGLTKAVLNSKLGRHQEAERALAETRAWAARYRIDQPNLLVPTLALLELSAAYLAEQRGDVARATQQYTNVNALTEVAEGRLALIAFNAGDETTASGRAQAALKNAPLMPTAHYVLGAIAERRGSVAAARTSYETAMRDIADAATRNPSFVLNFIERDRIAQALARLKP